MHSTNQTQAERELKRILEKYGCDGDDAARIKKWIYESDDFDSAMAALNAVIKRFFDLFPTNLPSEAMPEITKVFNEAWNAFPHRALKGKSPNQAVAEANDAQSPTKNEPPAKIICGGQEMTAEEYEDLLKEIEKVQKPFKRWIYRSVLPSYKKFLHGTLGASTAAAHFEVADIFFERALLLGFPDFLSIRSRFIQREFPRWWTTHVLMDRKTPKYVLFSLKKLFRFIAETYDIDIRRFGFRA